MAITILECAHEVVDQDPQFFIDPDPMKIISGANNLTIPQRATNAERLTFYLPEKSIEGHDLSACNQVLVHFRNIEEGTQAVSLGVDKITDLQVHEDGSVTLSWIIDGEATVYAGALIFSIHFACIAEDGSVVYNLPTLTYSGITVGETVWNSETIEKEYPDIIAEFESRISALEKSGVTQIDFTNFEKGIFTETTGGETITHTVSFDEAGRPVAIDKIQIIWGDDL